MSCQEFGEIFFTIKGKMKIEYFKSYRQNPPNFCSVLNWDCIHSFDVFAIFITDLYHKQPNVPCNNKVQSGTVEFVYFWLRSEMRAVSNWARKFSMKSREKQSLHWKRKSWPEMKPFEISFLILKSISLSRTFAFCRERLLMISWVTPIWARICLPQTSTWRNRERD